VADKRRTQRNRFIKDWRTERFGASVHEAAVALQLGPLPHLVKALHRPSRSPIACT